MFFLYMKVYYQVWVLTVRSDYHSVFNFFRIQIGHNVTACGRLPIILCLLCLKYYNVTILQF